jgi:hypothetical protein
MSRSRYYATAKLPECPPAPSPETCAFCGGEMEPRPGKRFCGAECRENFNTAERRAALEAFREARSGP